jgi:hypothetical protein
MKAAALGMLVILLAAGMWAGDRKMAEIRGDHWEISSEFPYFSMMLRGERGRLAITDVPFTPKRTENHMWFFWNNPQDLFGKPFQVNGVHWKSGKSYLLYDGAIPVSNRNSTNPARLARAMTALTLPTKGLWKLEAVIDGAIVGSIVVEVK